MAGFSSRKGLESLLLLFVMDAALVAVCWGGFGLPWVVAASILMWGTGDGAAALLALYFFPGWFSR